MSASHCIYVMVSRGVLLQFARCLNTAFGHYRIGVAVAELGSKHNLRAVLLSQEGSRGSCSSSPDNQHISLVVHLG